jgi:hypothetical protein
MITTCTNCGKLYEERGMEAANDPSRLCNPCYEKKHGVKLNQVCSVCGYAHLRPGHEKEDSQICFDMAAAQAVIDYAAVNWE